MADVEIKMNPVNSSNILSAGYNKEKKELVIKFNSNKTYTYYNVPYEYYIGMFEAESAGKFFRDWIIKGGYKFKQLKEDKKDENTKADIK